MSSADQVPASERLTAELHNFERLLGEAFASGGRLAIAAIGAQTSERLSVTAGHQVLGAISSANQSISEAMSRAAQAHRQLELLGRRLGLDTSAYGDVVKPPSASAQKTLQPDALAA